MNIALITEGGTDQIVLKPIVRTILEDEDITFVSLQPAMDNTDRQEGFGSWHLVLEKLKQLDLNDLFQTNDLLIVHVDSDVSFRDGFEVPHSESGGKVDPTDLLPRITGKLGALIPRLTDQNGFERVFFAIGIHSIECWLVGLVDPKHGPKVINGCFEKLNAALDKKNMQTISGTAKNKGASQRVYRNLAAQFSKKKTLLQQSKLNAGFAAFVDQLQTFKESQP